MVGAVTVMITVAHLRDVVGAQTVTPTEKVISTQVVVIGLAGKKEGFPLLGNGVTFLLVIPTAVQAEEHQQDGSLEEADGIEGEAEVNIKNKIWTQIPVQRNKQKLEPIVLLLP